MLVLTDVRGTQEAFTGFKQLKRSRKANGDKSIGFTAHKTDLNKHSFELLKMESIVEFDGEEYVIKQAKKKGMGTGFYMEIKAIHRFFVDMRDCFNYKEIEGSRTFNDVLTFIFEGTGYHFKIIDSFFTASVKLGKDNCLSLFKKALEAYNAEFYVIGKTVYIKHEIGNKTDFLFKYNHNVKALEVDMNTNKLSTIIRGYGGKQKEDGTYPIEVEYKSPNFVIYGERHAPPVYGEDYSTKEEMLERLKNDLVDEIEMSIKVDFADLRAAGYSFNMPSEGDYGFIDYEPMKMDLEARIVEIEEDFDSKLVPIKTAVVISNKQTTLTDTITRFEHTSKTIESIVKGKQQLPYNALDEAVKAATRSIKSAETELEFENGIVAVNPKDTNKLVAFNSNGIGISRDGGHTFSEAITPEGIVASAGVVGQFDASNIRVGPTSVFEDGYDPSEIAQRVDEVVNNFSKDGVITTVEKKFLTAEWVRIQKEFEQLIQLSLGYWEQTIKIIERDNINLRYDELRKFLTVDKDTNNNKPILDATNMIKDSIIDPSIYKVRYMNYYDAAAKLDNKIVSRAKELADQAQSNIDELDIKVNNIKIDARNIIDNSGNFAQLGTWIKNGGSHIALVEKDGARVVEAVGSIVQNQNYAIRADTEYVLTTEIMFSKDTPIQFANPIHWWMHNTTDNTVGAMLQYKHLTSTTLAKSNEWTKISILIKTKPTIVPGSYFRFFVYSPQHLTTDNKYWLRSVKLEEGNMSTGWTPSQKDAEEDLKLIDTLVVGLKNDLSTTTQKIDNMMSDSIMTPNEKQALIHDWNGYKLEKTIVEQQATTYGITTEQINYTDAFNALNIVLTPLFANMNADSNVNGIDIQNKLSAYIEKKAEVLKAITDKAKANVDAIEVGGRNLLRDSDVYITGTNNVKLLDITEATLLRGKELTFSVDVEIVKGKKDSSTNNRIGVELEFTFADGTRQWLGHWEIVEDGTNRKGRFSRTLRVTNKEIKSVRGGIYVQCTAELSRIGRPKIEKGNRATDWSPAPEDIDQQINDVNEKAKNVQDTVAEFTNDNKLVASEKKQLKKEWDIIVAELPTTLLQADTFKITIEKVAYEASYTVLKSYVEPLLSNLSNTSNLEGTKLRGYFTDYYNKKTILLKKISDAAKVYTDNELDPIRKTLQNITSDGKIDVTERQYVKDKIMMIIGQIPADTANLPTVSVIDTSKRGEVYSCRKEALNAGIPSTATQYKAVETEYTNLKTYLEPLSPKPWDTGITNTDKVIDVVATTWRDKWLKYYLSVDALRELTAAKLKNNADDAQTSAINAAKLDAKTKADEAQAAAIREATAKALAAETAAKAHADGKVTAEEAARIKQANDNLAAAKKEAADKAAAAELAAKNAAALDATTKANAAKDAAINTANNNTKKIREDMRLTSPLPSQIEMNSSGITAYAQGNPNKFARIDHRGFYAKGGAFAVERPDGAMWIENGVPRFDFTVDACEPPFSGNGRDQVKIESWWYTTTYSTFQPINFYSFRRTGRYLKIQLVGGSDGGGGQAIEIVDRSGKVVLAQITHGHWIGNGGEGFEITVDLGIPTMQLDSMYIKFRSLKEGVKTYLRKGRIWLEG
ncbi:phage tail protein [Priestia taiwanensis]|uniref:Uncharacterized protein n=1 Tax=Priestia taiwanensis TaxID=1347902 RepID=A0A917ENH3_9BACI|nr:phage tail protein [Priestia taiwanensis]MBM7362703.1 adenylate kinase family enzyme [Priestia taiwanensis]GGE64383.1 hypothetical protein GCM10007140_13260 [Priestia taiwanensis]